MGETPLRDGVRRLLETARNEEWAFSRALTADERERIGSEGVPEIKELVVRATAGRRNATLMLREVAAGRPADGCVEPPPGPVGTWAEAHRDAYNATAELLGALDAVDEAQLAANSGPRRNHPQYHWRDVVIYAIRGPMMSYAEWHHRAGREMEAIGVLSRWYEAVRGTDLPTKALSDASYDLACGLARAGRLDEAMEYLPDAFAYNDRAAVPVLKAWAREDGDLAPLAERPDFRALVGAA